MIEPVILDAIADCLPEDVTGWCYSASEALYYLAGGKAAGLKPVQGSIPNPSAVEGEPDRITHWWLTDKEGRVYDLTAEQFDFEWPYHEGRGRGFQTNMKQATTNLLRVIELKHNLCLRHARVEDAAGHGEA